MATYEVSRTLVKSPPELWAELEGDRLGTAVGAVNVRAVEPERELAWEADGAAGLARLEPSSWGTKVTLTAWVEELEAEVAQLSARLVSVSEERDRLGSLLTAPARRAKSPVGTRLR